MCYGEYEVSAEIGKYSLLSLIIIACLQLTESFVVKICASLKPNKAHSHFQAYFVPLTFI